MALSVSLSTAQLAQLESISDQASPNESCAFLFGSGTDCIVEDIMPLKSAELSPYSFSIAPSDLLEAYGTAERKGLQVIGIFHSHPGKPSPSSTDLKYMEINPVVWIIFSSTERKFAAYIADGDTTEVQIVVKD
jgi:proteasome lid subunit RPN8/RPN11